MRGSREEKRSKIRKDRPKKHQKRGRLMALPARRLGGGPDNEGSPLHGMGTPPREMQRDAMRCKCDAVWCRVVYSGMGRFDAGLRTTKLGSESQDRLGRKIGVQCQCDRSYPSSWIGSRPKDTDD